MAPLRGRRAWALVLASVWAGSHAAYGVIVGSGDGTQNTTAPAGIAGWNNVGTVNGASGIYLGNGWVLTAAHVGAGNITFDTVGTYNYDGTSAVRLTNSDSSQTDLVLYHLSSTPALSALNIASSSPALGTSIYSMGYGLSRDTSVTYYTAAWTTTSNPALATYAGYTENGSNIAKRWGTNVTRDNNGNGQALSVINAGWGNLTVFQSDFYSGPKSAGNGTTSESQLAAGDSGGAVFDSNNNLIGMNDATGGYTNQPADTAIYGDYSYYANLATYRDQIMSVIATPEPSVLAVLALAAPLALRRRRA